MNMHSHALEATVSPILLHVGYHKTGSTFLQQMIFDNPIRQFSTKTGRARHEIAQEFVTPDLFSFDAERVASSYQPWLDAAAERGETLVVSHERLAGYPANGGHDRVLIADRLKSVFGRPKVLMVIREQRAMILSAYSQYVTDGGDQSLKNFLQKPEPRLGRMPYFAMEYYDYDNLIRYYFKLFGQDNVLVLPFEMLRSSPSLFVGRIASHCGRPQIPPSSSRPVNDRRPLMMQSVQRFANRHLSRNELSPSAMLPIGNFPKRFGRLLPIFHRISPAAAEHALARRWEKRIGAAVGNRYRVSNSRTSELIGIDLSDFGYDCELTLNHTFAKVPEYASPSS